jgi:uncharacterized membrane protein
MRAKRKWGMVMLIIGIIFVAGSFYIKEQVTAGEKQIAGVEQKTDMADKLFSVTPESEGVGDKLTSPIKDKVSEGKDQIVFYTAVASWLKIIGIIFIVFGVAVLFFGKKARS